MDKDVRRLKSLEYTITVVAAVLFVVLAVGRGSKAATIHEKPGA